MSEAIYYLQVNITCFVILGILFATLPKQEIHSLRERLFEWMIAMAMVFCASDLVAGVCRGQMFAGARSIIWVANIVYSSSIILIGNLWIFYSTMVLTGGVNKKIFALFGCIGLVGVLLNVVTPWTGWFFTLDEANLYHRGSMIWINWVFVYACQILPILLVPNSKADKKEKTAILLYPIAPVIASVIQAVFYGISVGQTGTTLSLILMYVMLHSREINKHLRKQQILSEEKELAKQASEAKGRFLASMSHEIRTPINAVLGMNTMVLRESKEPAVREYAMNIQNAGQTLLSLVNDILDISKIESGKMELVPAHYELGTLINDVFNMIGIKAEASHIQLVLDVDSGLPNGLIGDDVRIRQILINILSNAVKYTESGTVTLTVKETKREADHVELHFSVKDTGIGIKEEDLHKLFAEYQRLDEEKNRNVEGTGLGINITYRLLKLMDSELQVSSVYGQGSDFFFDLTQEIYNEEPIGDVQANLAASAETYSYSVPFLAPDAEILLVDDNKLNRDVFAGLLKETQLKIEQAESGKEAIEKILSKKYDLVFLDHMMPDLDGIEVLKHVKAAEQQPNADTFFIVLTANAIAGARDMYMEAGFNDYLSKPILPKQLEKMLKVYLPAEKIHIPEGAEFVSEREADIPVCELPVVEGIDWNYGMLHYKDQQTLLNAVHAFYDMITVEAESLQGLFERVLTARANGDEEALKQYRVKVHSMKTSANLIGAFLLSGCAAMLEYAARDAEYEKIRELTPHFLRCWKAYKEKLAPLCKEETDESSLKELNAEETESLVKLLKDLSDALQDFDVHKADALMEELKKYTCVQGLEEYFERLKGYVSNLDGDQVECIRQQMMEVLGQ